MTSSARWKVRTIDEDTWTPGGEVDGIDSVTVSRSTNDSAPLLESADMDYTGELEEGYMRVEEQMSDGTSRPIATMLFSPDDSTWSHGTWSGTATGYSVLLPASERRFSPGEYAPKGVDVAAWCASILRSDIDAPVVSEGHVALGEHAVFDLGTTHLDGVWKVLDSVGWCLQIGCDGTVNIRELPSSPSFVADRSAESLLMPKVDRSLPVFDVPNVLKVYDGEQEAIARNEDPSSATSIPSKGREVEADPEESPTRREGETLRQYADRRLSEISEVYEKYDVEREWVDGVVPYDIVRSNLQRCGVTGDFRVMSQTIECEAGIKVGETWGRVA